MVYKHIHVYTNICDLNNDNNTRAVGRHNAKYLPFDNNNRFEMKSCLPAQRIYRKKPYYLHKL